MDKSSNTNIKTAANQSTNTTNPINTQNNNVAKTFPNQSTIKTLFINAQNNNANNTSSPKTIPGLALSPNTTTNNNDNEEFDFAWAHGPYSFK